MKVAPVAGIALSVALLGTFLVACWPASAGRLASPTPTGKGSGVIYLPTNVQLSAPSADIAWAFVADRLLFRSTDRGANWEPRPLPTQRASPQPEISFVDDRTGWFSTGGSPETQCNAAQTAVWQTTDGGLTWQLLGSNGIADAQCMEGLSFIDAAHGFLAAWDDNHAPTIYRTSDGGVTWKGITLPDPPGFATEDAGVALRAGLVKGFGSTLLLPASDNQGDVYVFRSTDEGGSWTYLAKVAVGANNLTLVSASRWLEIYNDSAGDETADAGKTWHTFASDYADAAGVTSTFVFGDTLVGYGTVRGGIQRTMDGGSHWVRIETPGVFQPG